MIVKYQKKLPGIETWEDVKSLDEINFEFLPYVFALGDMQVYESPTGMHFRAFCLNERDPNEPYSPMVAKLCQRLRQAELDMESWKEQAGQSAVRDIRFKRVAEGRRDEIQKALVVVMTKLADAFEGSHNERHTKLARVMTQIYEVSALCEKIPGLLVDAADDIPF